MRRAGLSELRDKARPHINEILLCLFKIWKKIYSRYRIRYCSNISLQLIQFPVNIFFCLCLVLSGLKFYVDATLIVNIGCVSVNFGLLDISFHEWKEVFAQILATERCIRWANKLNNFLKLNIKQDVSDIKICNGKEKFTQHFDTYIYNLILSDVSFLNCNLYSLFWTVLQVAKRIKVGHM